MRKLVLSVAFLLLGVTALPAQVNTPYKYGHRWNVAVFGGPAIYNGDYSWMFQHHYMWEDYISLMGGLSIGYAITNAHEVRLSANYSQKASVMVPINDLFYPYMFKSVQVFGDYMLSYRALGEYFTPFNPKMYVGLGVAHTFGFRTSWNDPELDLLLARSNVVPGFHFGMNLEYDFPSGFGLVFDLGLAYYLDPYNGLGYDSFPLDFDIDTYFGLVYHFKRGKNHKH